MNIEQQVMELRELYNAQQLLTAELSEKLERTEVRFLFINWIIWFMFCFHFHKLNSFTVLLQKKLEQTEQVLFDLEEKHRQANATIKEKEFLIFNLLKSGRKKAIFLTCGELNLFNSYIWLPKTFCFIYVATLIYLIGFWWFN